MTASGAEVFAAGIQDNARGRLVGWRTMGAGGSVEDWEAGSYSLGSTRVTESLMNRGHNVVTRRGHEETSYPVAPYVENIGVHPDLLIDYMTTDNLYQSGKPFVDAFVTAIVNQILNRPSGGVRGEGEGDNSTGRRSNDHEKTHPQGLTPAQKEADFRYLASLYSTYYAPLEWKKQLFGFNALNLKPWLDRVAMTTTDLDFYELCVEYVASLND